MGLDMYFEAKKSDWKSFGRWDADQGKADTTGYPDGLAAFGDYIAGVNFKSVSAETYYQIGYFRKFNALHGLIVGRLADGVDECQRISISKEDAEGILETLKAVQADHSKAESLLPTEEGCFFGGTEYDDWYFKDVDAGVEFFQMIVDGFDFDQYQLIYQASW